MARCKLHHHLVSIQHGKPTHLPLGSSSCVDIFLYDKYIFLFALLIYIHTRARTYPRGGLYRIAKELKRYYWKMIRVIRLSESHRRIDEFASFVSTIIFNLSRSGVEIGTVTDIFFRDIEDYRGSGI